LSRRKRALCSAQGNLPGIDDAPPMGAVAAHVFGQGMDDDVGAMLEGPAQIGRRHRVVHDQRHAVGMGHLRQGADVRHVAAGLPMDSQNTALVRSSISLAEAADGSR
jgi:hypothetical protein